MNSPPPDRATLDGRVARRRRNVNAVLDVVLDLFAEEAMFPTIEQVAERSGLSLRSLYRYFSNPGELLEAAIKRSREHGVERTRLPTIGEGPLHRRIDDFVAMRVGLYEAVGPVYRATVANAPRHSRIQAELTVTRNDLCAQFERQFEPELDVLAEPDRQRLLAVGDLLTQLDAIDFLRRHRHLTPSEAETVLISTLRTLLGTVGA